MAALSNNPEFAPEQAQLLQDIARNGSADEYNNTFEDLDPATLLQSLADFEHPTSHNEPHHFSEPSTISEPPAAPEHHFESLLQAVATADGEEAAQAIRGSQKQSAAKTPSPFKQVDLLRNAPTTTRTKRKRRDVESEDDEEDVGFIVTSKYKRQRKKREQDEAEQLAREREIWGPEYGEDVDEDGVAARQAPIAAADARAAGVHSAAALFRRPSAASKKYTRPPMAKVYTSLELSAEQFLHLQAAAKKYMLDEAHPERAECVGNRGKGDTDMTKLKLFACVASFLEDEGWGERCWGKSVPGVKSRKLQWPELKQQVVTSVTPLLRRMVTNERQRLYALESRAKGAHSKKFQGAKKAQRQVSPTPTEGDTPRPSNEPRPSAPSPSPYIAIDPKLNQYHYNVNESSIAQQSSTSQTQTSIMEPVDGELLAKADDENLKYLINIMQNGHRLKPKVTLTTASCPGYFSLVQHIHNIIDDETLTSSSIKVLGPGGMMNISSDVDWTDAINVIEKNVFMEGEVRCVVEIYNKL